MTTRTETAKATVSTKDRVSKLAYPGRPKLQLTGLEVESHILTNDPANNDEERSHEEGDLNAGADGDAHGKVHLVAEGNNNSGNVLSCIAHNRNKNKSDEGFTDMCCLDNILDTTNKIFSADGDQNSDNNEDDAGGDRAQGWLLGFVFFAGVLALRLEEVAVGSELENEV